MIGTLHPMIPRRLMALTAALSMATAAAVEIRVAAINVLQGVGTPGSASFEALAEMLERIDADVIAFSEVAAQVTDPGSASYFADLRSLVARLGFPTTRLHLATAGDAFAAQTFSAGEFGNSTQSLALASRFPITRSVQIGRGVPGRRELTRFPLFVRLDVPGTGNDPAFVVVHLKQGDTLADRFRKAVEGWRVTQFLASEGWNGADDHLFVLGDFNEDTSDPQPASFVTTGLSGGHVFADNSALPQTFEPGSDLPASLPYSVFPNSIFASAGVSVVPTVQADGVTDRTFNASGDARLDYLLAGAKTTGMGAVRAEVYNSRIEHAFDGLPKQSDLPSPGLSETASDHHVVFADVLLEPMNALAVRGPNTPVWIEDGPPAAVDGVASIAAPLAEPVVVTIREFRESVVEPIPPVIIPAGETSATFSFHLLAAGAGPDREITLVAESPGFRRAVGQVRTRRTHPTGDVVISQYTDPPVGASPRGIEVMNVSGREIVLGSEPLRVFRYTNGSGSPETEATVARGTLPRGGVLVIGDDAIGQFLVAEGRLPAPAEPFGNYPNGWVFSDAGVRAIFVKDGFTYNGNDAIELQLNFARCDVIGVPGVDPGAAWTDGIASTADQNLTRRRTGIAGRAALSAPGSVYEQVVGPPLEGFGIAPVIDDPYFEWAAARGLAGAAVEPLADPDADGQPNLSEFAFGAPPGHRLNLSGADPVLTFEVARLHRERAGNVRTGLEVWSAMGWRRVIEWPAEDGPAPPGEDYRESVVAIASLGPAAMVRFFAVKP